MTINRTLRDVMVGQYRVIKCTFIGDFKVGDNIAQNCASLCALCENNSHGKFNKLIVVQAGSIIEAALDQIFYRAQNHTREGVPNIPAETLEKIRGKEIERFNNIIQSLRAHEMLDGIGRTIYKDLDTVRELRNRIHIQFDDKPKDVARDEQIAFNDDRTNWALELCGIVLDFLAKTFPRPKSLETYAHSVSIPTQSYQKT